jgi:AcrR family transcriptional regulator
VKFLPIHPQEPRWRRLPGERPRQILEAALEVFGERGLAVSRLDDIAKRAGLSKGTIYLYFPNKEELFREVVRNTVVSNIESSEQEISAMSGPATEVLTRSLRAYWIFIRSQFAPLFG